MTDALHWLANVGLGLWMLSAAVMAALAWVARRGMRLRRSILEGRVGQIQQIVSDGLEPLLGELKPNGGGSIKDAVARIESELDRQGAVLAGVQGMAGLLVARVDTLIAADSSAWFEMDSRARVTQVNEAYRLLFDVDDYQAKNTMVWRSRIHPEDLARVDAEGQAMVSDHTRKWYVNFRVRHKDLLVPVESRSEPVWAGGEFRGWSGQMAPDWHNAVPLDPGEKWPAPPAQPWEVGTEG